MTDKKWTMTTPSNTWTIIRYPITNEYTQWRLISSRGIYKLYPKIFMMTTMTCFYIGIIYRIIKKDTYDNQEYNKLKSIKKQEYENGIKQANYEMTNGKINPSDLRKYVDLIVYIENKKKLKLHETYINKENEKYKTMIENLI